MDDTLPKKEVRIAQFTNNVNWFEFFLLQAEQFGQMNEVNETVNDTHPNELLLLCRQIWWIVKSIEPKLTYCSCKISVKLSKPLIIVKARNKTTHRVSDREWNYISWKIRVRVKKEAKHKRRVYFKSSIWFDCSSKKFAVVASLNYQCQLRWIYRYCADCHYAFCQQSNK